MAEHFLQTFVGSLKQQGKTEKEIQEILDSLVGSTYTLLMTNAMAVFSEDDLIAIEQCASAEDARQKVFDLYQERTGKKTEDELQEMLQKFTTEYLEGINKEEDAPSE